MDPSLNPMWIIGVAFVAPFLGALGVITLWKLFKVVV